MDPPLQYKRAVGYGYFIFHIRPLDKYEPGECNFLIIPYQGIKFPLISFIYALVDAAADISQPLHATGISKD